MSEVGHNSGSVPRDRLRSIVDRIERLESEKKALTDEVKEIYQEAKSAGYDCKVLRHLIRQRKLDPADLEELETLLDVYRRALGDFVSSPLGAAAMERVAARA